MEKNLKIAYISVTQLADSDLPLILELSKKADVDYYLQVSTPTSQGTVINMKLKKEGGIFLGTQYNDLEILGRWIDLSHVYIVNKPVNHDWELINFSISWKWMKLLKQGHYDIIHLTWPLRYCSFPLYFLRSKMILTMHDPIPHSSHQTIENRFHRWCSIHLTPNFILLNKTQKGGFIKKYCIDESRIYLSELSIYTHLKHTIPAPRLIDSPYILYVGSILPHKGIEYLCEAMLPITKEKKEIHVVIAGKGKFYFDKSKYDKNPNYIIINRFITNEELVSLISNCIAVVCPYIDATQSGVIMSAFALNKPVIATKVGALQEMVVNKRHGLLVQPKDTKELENAIRKIIQPEIGKQMSDFIQKDYSSGEHSWKEISANVLDIYNAILQKKQ